MRVVLLLLAAVIAAAALPRPSFAQSPYDYPICAYYADKTGATACYYRTYEQCMATMSGIGGHCGANPAYRGPAAAAGTTGQAVVKKPRRHRQY
jgi:hypothetical protein